LPADPTVKDPVIDLEAIMSLGAESWDGVIPPELDFPGRNKRPAVLEEDGFELVGVSKPGLG